MMYKYIRDVPFSTNRYTMRMVGHAYYVLSIFQDNLTKYRTPYFIIDMEYNFLEFKTKEANCSPFCCPKHMAMHGIYSNPRWILTTRSITERERSNIISLTDRG